MEKKVSEVHVPTRKLIRRSVLIWRVTVKVAVIVRSCKLLLKRRQERRKGGETLNFLKMLPELLTQNPIEVEEHFWSN